MRKLDQESFMNNIEMEILQQEQSRLRAESANLLGNEAWKMRELRKEMGLKLDEELAEM